MMYFGRVLEVMMGCIILKVVKESMTPSCMDTQGSGEKPQYDFLIILSY